MSTLLRSGLATHQDMICSHSPSNGSLWVRLQPRTRLLLSCSRYRVWNTTGLGTLLSSGTSAAELRSTEKTRSGADGRLGTNGEQLVAQRKTACCNCSSCSNKRIDRKSVV